MRLFRIDLLEPDTPLGIVFYAILFLVLAGLLSRALRLAVEKVLARDEHGLIDRTVASFLTQLAQIAIYVFALTFYAHLIPALSRVGTALLAGVSIASVVIGLAAQNTLGNLVAGVAILLYRPIRLDDLVQVTTPAGPETGVVERLTLGYTLLRTADDRRIIVPNSAMATQVTVNLNTWKLQAMAIVNVVLGGDEDVSEIRHALLAMGEAHPKVTQVIECAVRPHGESGVVLSLRLWCSDSETARQVERDLAERIGNELHLRGIAASVQGRGTLDPRAGG
jgi:small conductance mechanosensitive channel